MEEINFEFEEKNSFFSKESNNLNDIEIETNIRDKMQLRTNYFINVRAKESVFVHPNEVCKQVNVGQRSAMYFSNTVWVSFVEGGVLGSTSYLKIKIRLKDGLKVGDVIPIGYFAIQKDKISWKKGKIEIIEKVI